MNVLIADVGGKNAEFVAHALLEYGDRKQLGCKMNRMRIAGESGSIITHLRFGENICSPTVPFGEADGIISFDILEAARTKHFLCPKGILLVNDKKIETGFARGATYPNGLKSEMLQEINGVYFIDGDALAQAEDSLSAAMLGAFTRLLGLDKPTMLEIIVQTSNSNQIAAFERGYLFLK